MLHFLNNRLSRDGKTELSRCGQKRICERTQCILGLQVFLFFLFFNPSQCLTEGMIRDCVCQRCDGIRLRITDASGEPPLVDFGERDGERLLIRLPPLVIVMVSRTFGRTAGFLPDSAPGRSQSLRDPCNPHRRVLLTRVCNNRSFTKKNASHTVRRSY